MINTLMKTFMFLIPFYSALKNIFNLQNVFVYF